VAELQILIGGEMMGTVIRNRHGRLTFSYSEEWLRRQEPVPLSLSMPVLPVSYGGDEIENWLWGLLPDNEDTLRRWAQSWHVSPRNVFALLEQVGEDVAGAIQIVRPDRAVAARARGKVRWLTSDELRARVTALREDAANARWAEDPGRFSLAGVQSKTALLYQDGQWGVPAGRTPTNRIVKLAAGAYDGLIENEHFCMRLAAQLGLNAASTSVMMCDDVTAIVVERYDRVDVDGQLVRLHQEDMCQTLGLHPTSRYQNAGGPSVTDLFNVLNNSSEPEVDRDAFLRAQVFNFLVGGTDAHAKNFSLLLGDGGTVRLAPLYDIASMLPYINYGRIRLAMRIGSSYSFHRTLPRHWQQLGDTLRNVNDPVQILEDYANQMQVLVRDVSTDCKADGILHPIIDRLAEEIRAMCERTISQIRLYYGRDE